LVPLAKNTKVKTLVNKTIILPFVLYGYETWSSTLKEEHRLRMLQNRVLKKVLGSKRKDDGESFRMRWSFVIFTPH
jgi:hypothetical protein